LDTISGLSELERRRKALLVESELNRQALRLEVLSVTTTVQRIRNGFLSGQSLWKWLAPVAGFLIARKLAKPKTSGIGASSVLNIGRALWTAWRERRKERA
jgi:hypothetical protein